MWEIKLLLIILLFQLCTYSQKNSSEKEWEAFPILNYDTDVGFGYGFKGFFYNFLEKKESFDLTVYNSTKGERWYQFIFSSPDIQRRQGTKYDGAIDVIIDYDKYINYTYYSDNNRDFFNYDYYNTGSLNKHEQYVREPIEVKLLFSKAYTTDFIAEYGLQFRSISCYGFDPEGILRYNSISNVKHISILFNFRLDTRNNFINPQKGILAQINNEYAKDVSGKNQSFYKIELLFQSYINIFHPKIIFANRIKLQQLFGMEYNNYQNLLYLGGNNSIRGLPQSRYLSESAILLNEEIRFPIWWRFGGIIGIDIGNSETTPEWIINSVTGLRFYMDNFIVRFDIGFGKDITGIYFNFGHLF